MAASKIFLFLVTTKLLMPTVQADRMPGDALKESMEQMEENCGVFEMKSKYSTMARIIGGEDAPSVPPWMVKLTVRFKKVDPKEKESMESGGEESVGYLTKDDEGNEESQFRQVTVVGGCGGSIIDQYNIVTASHCFDGEQDEKFISVDVDFGGRSFVTNDTWKKSKQETKGRFYPKWQLHGIDKKYVIKHENYTKGDENYDIALIHLPFRIDLAQSPEDEQNVRQVCLPNEYDLKKKHIDTHECFLNGWGRLCENGPVPEALQQAKMPILDDDTCQKKLEALKVYDYDPNVVLCAVGDLKTGEPSSCYGDSGGPLVCRKMVNYKTNWVLMGIVSGAAGYCGQKEMPIRFVRVSALTDWIMVKKKRTAELKKEIKKETSRLNKQYKKINKKIEQDPPPPIIGSDNDEDNENKPERHSRKPRRKDRRRGRRRPRKHRPSESDDEHEPDEDQEHEHEPRPRRKTPSENQFSGGNQIIITNNNNNLNQNLEDSLSGGETTTKQRQETTEEPRHNETKDKPKNEKRNTNLL